MTEQNKNNLVKFGKIAIFGFLPLQHSLLSQESSMVLLLMVLKVSMVGLVDSISVQKEFFSMLCIRDSSRKKNRSKRFSKLKDWRGTQDGEGEGLLIPQVGYSGAWVRAPPSPQNILCLWSRGFRSLLSVSKRHKWIGDS